MVSILTLNIMHGRNKRGVMWPPRVGRGEVKLNLEKIANLVRAHQPDIVALQEVDEHSVLSGGFDQSEFLKEKSGYSHGYFAPSCSIKGLFVSGQAILSRYPLANCASYKFPITFPTDRMGFVMADVQLPDSTVTVASVHLTYLDLLRRNARERQMELVERVVAKRGGKAIIAGDFNCDIGKGKPTYPSWAPEEPIDWVLGRGLTVSSCRTLPDLVSDHLAVSATLSE